MKQNTYVIFALKIHLPNRVIRTESLVYEYGVKQVFTEASAPDDIDDFLGKIIHVEFDDLVVQSIITKEISFQGISYNLKFSHPPERIRKYIRLEIKKRGIPTPWQRKYVRLSTAGASEKAPVPAMASLRFDGEVFFLNVINFTLGGLLLEANAMECAPIKIGEKLNLDIMVNQGDSIPGVTVQAMHICEDFKLPDLLPIRLIGVQFESFTTQARNKYNKLIKDYCESWREKA